MKLGTVKMISYVLLGVISLLLLTMGVTQILVFGYLAIAVVVVFSIWNLIFWRCPHCGKNLGRIDDIGEYCRYCGKEIDL